MAQIQELTKLDEWSNLLKKSFQKPVLLLKHSTRCPVSAEAHDQFLKHVAKEGLSELEYALVLVVESRPISNAVAEELGIKHESPQALLIRNGQSVWHASHWRITSDELKEQAVRAVRQLP